MKTMWPPTVGEIWSSSPRLSIPDLVMPALRADPDATALCFDDGTRIARGDLARAVDHFAEVLERYASPGQRVALLMSNRAEFLVAWLAILEIGAVGVRINPEVGERDARHVLEDSGAVVVVTEPTTASRLARTFELLLSRPVVLTADGAEEPFGFAHLGGVGRGVTPRHADPDERASIHYTSGTTGLPKGCVSSHAGFARYVDLIGRLYPVSSDDTVLSPLQFCYGDSLWLFVVALRSDAEYVAMRSFSVSRFWDVVRAFGVTVILGIGSVPSLLLTAAPSAGERDHRVRMALQVAVPAAQHAALIARFGFPWIEIYGQSESGITVAMPAAAEPAHVGTGAIGIPVPEVEVRVVDEMGTPLGPGAVSGQLEVLAPCPMLGYLDDPASTAELIGHDGWLRTGDRVRRDTDGVLFFLGRAKEIIRRGGVNIAPHEIEAVLRLHEDVIDCAVVPVPDDVRGEEIKAYVQVRSSQTDPAALAAFCAGRLAPYKVPRFIELRRDDLPRTPSLRVLKSALAQDGVHTTDACWDRATA